MISLALGPAQFLCATSFVCVLTLSNWAYAQSSITQVYAPDEAEIASFVDQVKTVREIAGEWEVLFEDQRGVFGLEQNPKLQPIFTEAQTHKLSVRVKYDRDTRQIMEASLLGSQREDSGPSRGSSIRPGGSENRPSNRIPGGARASPNPGPASGLGSNAAPSAGPPR